MATKNTLLKKITSGRSTNPTTELEVSQPVEYVYDLCFYTFVCFYSNIMSSSKKNVHILYEMFLFITDKMIMIL